MASTDRRSRATRASHGSTSSSSTVATPSARRRGRPWRPSRAGPPSPSPRPAPRSARGGPAARTRARRGPDDDQPSRPHARPAGDQQQEADDQREVGPGHRGQVGEPAGAEVLDQVGRHRPVVADDERRHQGSGLGDCRPRRRGCRPHRLGSGQQRPAAPAPPVRAGLSTAAAAPGRPAESSRPVLDRRPELDVGPGGRRSPAPARVARTVAAATPRRPSSRTTTKSPNRPCRITGSEVTRAVTVATARCSASRATGPVVFASARTAPHDGHRGGAAAARRQPTGRAAAPRPPAGPGRRPASTDPARAARSQQPARPGSRAEQHHPQVGARPAGARPAAPSPAGPGLVAHRVTNGAISASVASPMPETSSSSSTALKAPWSPATGGSRPRSPARPRAGCRARSARRGVEVDQRRAGGRRPTAAAMAGPRRARHAPRPAPAPRRRAAGRGSAGQVDAATGAPAASSASTTRAPMGSRTMPGRRTLPATSTTTSADRRGADRAPAPAEPSPDGAGSGRRPGRQRRRCDSAGVGADAPVDQVAGVGGAHRPPGEERRARPATARPRRSAGRDRRGPGPAAWPAAGSATRPRARLRDRPRADRAVPRRGWAAVARRVRGVGAGQGRLAGPVPDVVRRGITGSDRIAASSALSSSSRRRATSATWSLADLRERMPGT